MSYKVKIADRHTQELQNVCENAIANVPYLRGVVRDLGQLPDIINGIVTQDVRLMVLLVLYSDETPVGILFASTINGHPAFAGLRVGHELAWYVEPVIVVKDSCLSMPTKAGHD